MYDRRNLRLGKAGMETCARPLAWARTRAAKPQSQASASSSRLTISTSKPSTFTVPSVMACSCLRSAHGNKGAAWEWAWLISLTKKAGGWYHRRAGVNLEVGKRWASIRRDRVEKRPCLKSSRRFFHIEAQLLHGRPIVDGEKNGVIVTSVFVVVPLPCRHGENVPFVTLQPLVFDDHGALTFKRKVEGSAVMAG